MEKTEVTVFCIAYNQQKYIEKTLKSLVEQETSFRYEVLVHDDASTDGTADIIAQYAIQYPHIIRAVVQKENQYSRGRRIVREILMPMSRSEKYVAFCEGDDYWCDKHKLQEQYDALESNPTCSFSSHITRCVDRENMYKGKIFPIPSIKGGIVDKEILIHWELTKYPWLFHTSSFFVRKSVYQEYHRNYHIYAQKFPVGDKPLLLSCLLKGDCYFIDKVMSAYRMGVGVMTNKWNSIDKRLAFNSKCIEAFKGFDEFTEGKYRKDIEYRIRAYEANSLIVQCKYRELYKQHYIDVLKEYTIKRKIWIVMGILFPRLIRRVELGK